MASTLIITASFLFSLNHAIKLGLYHLHLFQPSSPRSTGNWWQHIPCVHWLLHFFPKLFLTTNFLFNVIYCSIIFLPHLPQLVTYNFFSNLRCFIPTSAPDIPDITSKYLLFIIIIIIISLLRSGNQHQVWSGNQHEVCIQVVLYPFKTRCKISAIHTDAR